MAVLTCIVNESDNCGAHLNGKREERRKEGAAPGGADQPRSMNPFSNFNHFIAFFVPGIVLATAVLAAGSLAVGKDLVALVILGPTPGGSVVVTIVFGAFFGLLIDEARHAWVEDWFDSNWATERQYDLDQMGEDFICHVSRPDPPVTLNAYLVMIDESFHFYEFDINMGIALVFSAVVIPFYLDRFYLPWGQHTWFFVLLPLAMSLVATGFFLFGINAYEYFLDVFVDAMERGSPGFKASIRRNNA